MTEDQTSYRVNGKPVPITELGQDPLPGLESYNPHVSVVKTPECTHQSVRAFRGIDGRYVKCLDCGRPLGALEEAPEEPEPEPESHGMVPFWVATLILALMILILGMAAWWLG